jgi:hypothetical protein
MRYVTFASIILLTMTAQAPSQQDEKVTFHVTSVEQSDATDWCTTGKCSATRITVEGYTQEKDAAVQYVLDCVEVVANEPTPHKSIQCVKVHSHVDYEVTIGADFILFASDAPTKQEKEPFVSGYRIKSEKEVRKK